ncbi:MAG: LysR family transcriptional regulator [Polyangiales bacterium]
MALPRAPALQLDPDCLDALVAFAEDCNLTTAAKTLHRGQPTVHAQLKRLADAVGSPLYERRGRTLALTAAGSAVLAFARDSRERIAVLEATLARSKLERPVTLATGEGALLYLLGPALVAFRKSHAKAPALLIGDRDTTVRRVREGQAHLGVTAIDGASLEGLRVERIATVRTAVVVSARHPLARNKRVRWEMLRGVALVLPPAPSALRTAAINALEGQCEIAIEARGWPLAMHCARLGLGVAIVNDFCEPPKGCVRRPLEQGPAQPYALLSRADAVESEPVRSLRERILGRT